jgi:hypothetical protein
MEGVTGRLSPIRNSDLLRVKMRYVGSLSTGSYGSIVIPALGFFNMRMTAATSTIGYSLVWAFRFKRAIIQFSGQFPTAGSQNPVSVEATIPPMAQSESDTGGIGSDTVTVTETMFGSTATGRLVIAPKPGSAQSMWMTNNKSLAGSQNTHMLIIRQVVQPTFAASSTVVVDIEADLRLYNDYVLGPSFDVAIPAQTISTGLWNSGTIVVGSLDTLTVLQPVGWIYAGGST